LNIAHGGQIEIKMSRRQPPLGDIGQAERIDGDIAAQLKAQKLNIVTERLVVEADNPLRLVAPAA
jgi:hypothetical protein